VFKNRALGKIFGQKWEEETGDSQDLYCSKNNFRAIKRMWEERISYRSFVGELERQTQFGRPKRRWEAIKVDFKEIELGSMDWIDLAQDRDK